MLDFILKDSKGLSTDKTNLLALRRIQSRNNKWVIIHYIETAQKNGVGIGVRVSACQPDYWDELEKKRTEARILAKKISKMFHEMDPANLNGDAPEDEYDAEAEEVAERLLLADEQLSPDLLKDVFENWISPGCCSENTYEKIASRLSLIG